MTPEQRRHIALHESGHAVASIVLSVALEYVSIRPGKTFGGQNVPAPGEPLDASELTQFPSLLQPLALRDHVERRIVVQLAGELAALWLADEPGAAFTSGEAETIAQEALVALGPRLAELVVEHEEREEPSDGDEANTWHLAHAFVGDEGVAYYLELLRIEARALVIRYRDAILRVAAELERRAVLEGAQVASLVFEPKGAN